MPEQLLQQFINQLQIPFIIFIALIFVTSMLKSRRFKGWFGEWLVKKYLSKKLNNDYQLINDITLKTLDNNGEQGSTQIDHLVVSKYGLFVIETKNMKGWIFGSAKQKWWTQKIYRYSNKFQNPLRQNYKHTQTLIEQLNLNKDHVFSVIVFVGDSEFKTEMPENVTYPRGMLEFIQSKTEAVMTDAEVILLRDTILAIKMKAGFKTNREHVKHLHSINRS